MMMIFRAIGLSALLSLVSAQDCYNNLFDISFKEIQLPSDGLVNRQYILCPGTTFTPGNINAAQNGFDGDWPLILRSKATVQCGNSGASSENCIIDGTGMWGLWIDPLSTGQETDKQNIVIKGITFKDFIKTEEAQTVVFFLAAKGKVTMEDCVFDNVGCSSPFFYGQLFFSKADAENRARYLDELDRTALPGVPAGGWNFTDPEDVFKMLSLGINNTLALLEKDADIPERRHLSSVNAMTSNGHVAADTNENLRGLQGNSNNPFLDDGFEDGPLNIWFKSCTFKDINMVAIPQTNNAHTILYVTGIIYLDYASGAVPGDPTPARLNLRIWDTTFTNIKAALEVSDGDIQYPTRRSVVEFQSDGKFFLKNTCFTDIEIPSYDVEGVILIQANSQWKDQGSNSKSNIKFRNGETPSKSGCEFMTIYDLDTTADQNYGFLRCPQNNGFNLVDQCGDSVEDQAPVEGGFGGGFAVCFSSENTAQLANGDMKRFNQLQLGDEVLTQKGFEPIYSFGHYNPKEQAEFVQLLPSRIELSSTHLVFLQDGNAVPAEAVEAGNVLLSGEIVTGKRYVTRQGLYAPFTASGTIIANGQVASSFVSLQGTPELMVNGWSTGISHQWMAHAFELPHRLWCLTTKMGGGCLKETYTSDGISTWVSLPLEFFSWFVDANVIIQVLLAVPILGVFGFFSGLEYMLTMVGHNQAVVLMCFIGVILYVTPFQIRKVKCE